MLIVRTLESTGQNKTRAAEILGVSLKTLHNKLKDTASPVKISRPEVSNGDQVR